MLRHRKIHWCNIQCTMHTVNSTRVGPLFIIVVIYYNQIVYSVHTHTHNEPPMEGKYERKWLKSAVIQDVCIFWIMKCVHKCVNSGNIFSFHLHKNGFGCWLWMRCYSITKNSRYCQVVNKNCNSCRIVPCLLFQ